MYGRTSEWMGQQSGLYHGKRCCYLKMNTQSFRTFNHLCIAVTMTRNLNEVSLFQMLVQK